MKRTSTAAPLLWTCSLLSPLIAPAVDIYPGTDIQTVVNSNPPGTTYILKAGVHRRQWVRPQDGDTFMGEPGTILNGAVELTAFNYADGLWFIGGQVPRGITTRYPECEPDHEGCGWSEDLFFDDVPLRHVDSFSRLGPGKWFFDKANQTIYLVDNPAGHKVERSVIRHAFYTDDYPAARNVTIQGLLIEKYAAPAAFGAIHVTEPGWTIQNNEVRLNHGAGLVSFATIQVLGNKIHHNGAIGLISDFGNGSLFENNEISFNNYARFTYTSDNSGAGGTKFFKTNNLVVRGNFVHDNGGPGLWTDTENRNTLYENNLVTDNEVYGIFHEISWDAIIRNNICKRNGRSADAIWNTQIFINNSSNGEIYGNDVEVDAQVGNGIVLFQSYRGSFNTTNNYVHDNIVTYSGDSGIQSGAGFSGASHYLYPGPLYTGNNRFDYNHYYVANVDDVFWMWDQGMTWDRFYAAGQERNGTRQSSGQCGFSVSTGDGTFASGGGRGSLSLTSSPNCAWVARSTMPWINVNSDGLRNGSSTVSFSVAASTDPLPRTASLISAGFVTPIIQRGAAAAQRFADVPPSHVFFDHITLLAQNRITVGCGPEQFCPEANVTRGQMAVFVIRAKLGENFPFRRTPFFQDVPESHPYFKYIQKMKELGITSGCSQNPLLYCADWNVTRAEMAVFLIRAKLSGRFDYSPTPYFTDVPASHEFFGFIQKMKELGLTNGCSPIQYCVSNLVTRGQMAVFLIRAFRTP